MTEIATRLAAIEARLARIEDARTRRLSVKELAPALGRGERYVRGMKRAGFRMPGGLATLAEALEWLDDHPDFRANG